MEPVFQQTRRQGAAAAKILVLSSLQCSPGRAVSHSFHVKAGLTLQFPVLIQSEDPGDIVMKA